MPLTDTVIKKANPETKARKLYDERRPFLLTNPKGGVNGGDLNAGLMEKKSCYPLGIFERC